MSSSMFMGYASKPELNRETLYNASRLIGSMNQIEVVPWENLKVGGRVLISQVLNSIDRCDVCAVDLSTLNENVLFELGYAIAIRKKIWILLDKTDAEAGKRWKDFQLLTGVGYCGWENSEDIRKSFIADRPDLPDGSLYDDLLPADLAEMNPGSLFYVQTYHATEAARHISRRLEYEGKRGVQLMLADPTESSLNPLQWYASKAYETQCSILHFEAPRRTNAALHNQRSALVGGIACGLGRPVLMLAEEDYSRPLDYGDLLKVYNSAKECEQLLDAWLTAQNLTPRVGTRTPRIKIATELRALRFGEYVAENERDSLSDYFVETASFDSVMADRGSLFVGRKGTGKTASMYLAAARLQEDARNLVVVIKPASYEFSSLLSLLKALPVSLQQYSIEALWKFLLTSEIANRVVDVVEARAPSIPYTNDEKLLLDFVETNAFSLRSDFGARFESTVTSLEGLAGTGSGEAAGRDFLNEALHSAAISRLRSLLGPVLKNRSRVAVLIDNLDKGWERAADLDLLSRLLLGLLSAVGRVDTDFSKQDYWRDKIRLTVTTFLRSDIYDHLRSVAREPDKMSAAIVAWEDPSVLIRVIEERFLAARPEGTEPSELWERFFCPTVRGQSTKKYIVSRCLPRPRDLVYWCNEAVVRAADRGNQRIEESDVLTAETAYSQFAFEALLVENEVTIEGFKEVLLEFLGEATVLSESAIREIMLIGGVADTKADAFLDRLMQVSFIGIETGPSIFTFPMSSANLDRAKTKAKKHLRASGAAENRYEVHSAYRAYLQMQEADGYEFSA